MGRIPVRRRAFVQAAAGSAVSLLVAACAPPSASPTTAPPAAPTSAPPAPPTSAPPAAKATPSVAVAKPAATAAPTFAPARIHELDAGGQNSQAIALMMKEQGFFTKYGLTAEVENLQDSSKIMPSILNGSADLTGPTTDLGLAIRAIDAGAPLKVIGGGVLRLPFSMYTGNPDVKSLKDLEGRSLGIGPSGTLLDTTSRLIFKKNGVDESKVSFVNIGGSLDIFKAIVARKVDAGLGLVNFQASAAENNLRSIADCWQELPDYVTSALVTNDDAIAKKRDVLVRGLAAIGHTFRFLRTPESLPVYVGYFKQIGGTEADGKADWTFFHDTRNWPYDLALSDQQLNYMQGIEVANGKIKAVMPISKIADMSLARDAVKLITIS